jgi:hypothetical protein
MLVQDWEPECLYDNEGGYRDELTRYLRQHLEDYESVGKEDGCVSCDIGIGKKIGIELKLHLTKPSDTDRLMGQILRCIDHYPAGIIVLLLGDTTSDALQTINTGVKKLGLDDRKLNIIKKPVSENSNDTAKRNGGSRYGDVMNPDNGCNRVVKEQNDLPDNVNAFGRNHL